MHSIQSTQNPPISPEWFPVHVVKYIMPTYVHKQNIIKLKEPRKDVNLFEDLRDLQIQAQFYDFMTTTHAKSKITTRVEELSGVLLGTCWNHEHGYNMIQHMGLHLSFQLISINVFGLHWVSDVCAAFGHDPCTLRFYMTVSPQHPGVTGCAWSHQIIRPTLEVAVSIGLKVKIQVEIKEKNRI